MGFYYSRSLVTLKMFYQSMRKIDVQIGTFEYTYNEVVSDVIFDTRDSKLWKIIFIKRILGEALSIPIQRGYYFTIDGIEKYYEIVDYFGIGRGKGNFKINEFVNHLSSKVPSKYDLLDEKRKIILKYDKLDSESEGIFPVKLINWESVHAKNSLLPKDKYHRTSKNLSKTRQLYPNLYAATKDMDITIVYGVLPSEQTEKIKILKLFN